MTPTPSAEPREDGKMKHEFFVCDLRREFAGQSYITFWRPKNSNYAWPIEWSGRYSVSELQRGYHDIKSGRTWERFPVPCEVAELLSEESEPRKIDGGQWQVVKNTPYNRMILRQNRFEIPRLESVGAQ